MRANITLDYSRLDTFYYNVQNLKYKDLKLFKNFKLNNNGDSKKIHIAHTKCSILNPVNITE